MRDKPMTWDELPRVTNAEGKSVVDWASVGFESIDKNPEDGKPWTLHRDNGIAVNGCVFLWLRDASKAIEAGMGEAILACANGTSWKVSQDDVNRQYDRRTREKGTHGAKVRETLEHMLWDRLTGIRRKAEYRAPTVKVVEVTKVVIALADGRMFAPSAATLADAAAELRSEWMDAMLSIGVPPQSVPALAQSQDFEAMLQRAGWSVPAKTPAQAPASEQK